MFPTVRFVRAVSVLAFAAVLFLAACDDYIKIKLRDPRNKPQAPAAVAATAGIAQVTISWAANPEPDVVTSYTLYSAIAPWAAWSQDLPSARVDTNLACCSFTVGNLENDATYAFTLSATNVLGESDRSSQVTATPPGWVGARMIGTSAIDEVVGVGVAADGSIVLTGRTVGGIDGYTNQGLGDVFVQRYDAAGRWLWTRQTGSAQDDSARIAIGLDGSILVGGSIGGAIDGQAYAGNGDVFVMKLNSSGVRQWTRLIGTASGEYGGDVGVDSVGNVYVCGTTNGLLEGSAPGGGDGFLAKYDTNGDFQWVRQFGLPASSEMARRLAVDGAGDVIVVGETPGSFGGANQGSSDVFIVKYNSLGSQEWVRQRGSSVADGAAGIGVVENEGVVIVGSTQGEFDGHPLQGAADVFLLRLDAQGAFESSGQFGGPGSDGPEAVAVLPTGECLIGGQTTSSIFGRTFAGGVDLFLAKISFDNDIEWATVLGTSANEWVFGLAATPNGRAYVGVGSATGSLFGPFLGGEFDGHLFRIDSAGTLQ